MINCPHCGKDNKDGTSFCRGCGKPTGALNQQPAAATRMLDPGTMPVPRPAETQSVNPPPQYQNPSQQPVVQYQPVAAAPQKRKRRIWPVLLISFLLIVAAIVVVGVVLVRKAAVAAENFKEEIKKEIPIPDATTPTTDSVKSYLGDLYYPGSVPQSGLSQGDNRLFRLKTSDSIDKVADYYKSKLTDSTPINKDEDSFTFLFKKDRNTQGLITGKSENGTTEIMLAIGDAPPVPTVPGYPKPPKRR